MASPCGVTLDALAWEQLHTTALLWETWGAMRRPMNPRYQRDAEHLYHIGDVLDARGCVRMVRMWRRGIIEAEQRIYPMRTVRA